MKHPVKRYGAILACLLAADSLQADLIAVFDNGRPIAPGQAISSPAGGTWLFVHIPNMDLFYQWYVPPPAPPPPPKTYRVVDPTGKVTDLGDGSKGKPKQKGDYVEIDYSDSETIRIKGTLLSPGDPNPAPANNDQGMLFGPSTSLSPAVALADVQLLLAQPELSDVFSSPIGLSYFQYDFFGSTPFPVFQREATFVAPNGTSSTVQVVPEPTTLVLFMSALGLLLRHRGRLRTPAHVTPI